MESIVTLIVLVLFAAPDTLLEMAAERLHGNSVGDCCVLSTFEDFFAFAA